MRGILRFTINAIYFNKNILRHSTSLFIRLQLPWMGIPRNTVELMKLTDQCPQTCCHLRADYRTTH